MSQETKQNISAQKAARSAMQRVEQLENVVPQIIRATQQTQAQFSQAMEILDAVVQTLGTDVVENAITENRRVRARATVADQIKDLEAKKATGERVVSDTVTENTTLVFSEADKDGKALDPDRTQLDFDTLIPQFKEELLLKGVGAKIVSPTGNTFELKEIYEKKVVEKLDLEALPEDLDLEASSVLPEGS